MYSIIVCAHGDLAESFKRSIEMIFGKVENLFPIRFVQGENPDDIKKKITETIDKNDLKSILILTDLFCGSPYNASASLAFENSNIEVICGVNLPICLEAVSNQNMKNLTEIVSYIKQIAPETVKSFRDVLNKQDEEGLI
ncbi:PTS sugar transporter subunit IIA [Sporolactobacillus pectinivorans]|uniref:PTS sugar transporter subunit IIA n=1 Tax=Sporolactobacillus pectinivorans TaxID=1591408 RepID=UPI000C2675C2|nr:PTS sugar transporter subunit IIA [Sporolactobacillus pectinivorans]